MPGNASVRSCAGSNRLLKEGAALVETGWDVMSQYREQFPDRVRMVRAGQTVTLSPNEVRRNLQPVRKEPSAGKTAGAEPASDKKAVDNPGQRDYIVVQDIPGLSEEERRILTALQDGPLGLDDLVEASGVGPGPVLVSLTMLEIKHYVVQLLNNRYELARKKEQLP